MWSNLPFDLLSTIFSHLSPESLARAKAVCRSWQTTADFTVVHHQSPPWFLALPTPSMGPSCYIHNPIENNWHVLSLDHISSPIRPIATICGLILMKITTKTCLQLAICNPFTRQFRALPMLSVTRTNPAVGFVHKNNPIKKCPNSAENSILDRVCSGYKIYVAGGMSEPTTTGGSSYHSTIEMYDSDRDTWQIIGQMPVEFAVRLTVWTPHDSVFSKRVLYWMTSARTYSIMGFEIETKKWRELSVPMGDKLEFAALVSRNGNPTIVGAMCGGDACIWELGEGDVWNVVEKLPIELRIRLIGNPNWGRVKCVGINGAICLYRNIGSGIIVWRQVYGKEKWEWDWIEGLCSINGKEIHSFPIKGLLIHPNISHFSNIF